MDKNPFWLFFLCLVLYLKAHFSSLDLFVIHGILCSWCYVKSYFEWYLNPNPRCKKNPPKPSSISAHWNDSYKRIDFDCIFKEPFQILWCSCFQLASTDWETSVLDRLKTAHLLPCKALCIYILHMLFTCFITPSYLTTLWLLVVSFLPTPLWLLWRFQFPLGQPSASLTGPV